MKMSFEDMLRTTDSKFFKSLTNREFDVIERTLRKSFPNFQLLVSFENGVMETYEIIFAGILGEYYAEKKYGEQAVKFLDKCMELYEKNSSLLSENETFAEFAKKIYYEAVRYLGNVFFNGLGVRVDYKKAFRFYKKAADEYDDYDSQNILACMYSNGWGVEQNTKIGADYFERSALQGNMFAQNSLGRLYEFGIDREKNLEKAFYWYKKAADQGDDLAAENLMRLKGAGNIPLMGSYEFPNADVNGEDAVESLKEKAEQGDEKSQVLFAASYLNGIFVTKDKEKAFELFTKYADAGNPFAQYELGNLYKVEENPEKSFHYFLSAAKQGIIGAKYNVGCYYFQGFGVEKNARKVFQWMLSAAKDGHPCAQYMVGVCYYFGVGCESDIENVLNWMKKSAKQGNYYAQLTIVNLCKNGFIKNRADALYKKWSKILKKNTNGNTGCSEPIVKIGEIPNINDFDEEDKNYFFPESFDEVPVVF